MAAPPAPPHDHYTRQKAAAAAAVLAAQRAVRTAAKRPADWAQVVAGLTKVMVTYQATSANQASQTLASSAGTPPLTNPLAFAGQTSLGYPLADPLQILVDDLEKQLDGKVAVLAREAEAASTAALWRIDRFVRAEVTDAGREAAHVEIIGRPQWQNYVRVLNLPSCKRCVVLAGRIYRDLDHFDRHPQDDCEMWPVQDWAQAKREGLVTDPVEAIKSGKVSDLSEADTRAIVEDGADPFQVINATQGTSQPGVTAAYTAEIFGQLVQATTAGTTAQAAWRKAHPNLPIRLRPGAIYKFAADRDDAIRLLRLYGYLR